MKWSSKQCSELSNFPHQRLVDALSEEDREIAARTSYAYWYASIREPNERCLTPTIRNNMAKKEARRHLVGKGGDEDLARKTLQASLEYRKVSTKSVMEGEVLV